MSKYSQTNEQEIIDSIFNKIGTTNKYCVEFGAGNGYTYSNTRHLLENGWNGLMMDGEHTDNEDVKHEFICRENICSLLYKYEVPKQFDLLSIDLDGNDIWILEQLILQFSPRVIVAEFNPSLTGNKTIKYDIKHVWNNDDYYGASMEAFKILGSKMGYTIVDNNGLNLFMIRGIGNAMKFMPFNDTCPERHDHTSSERNDWIEFKSIINI